jgi:hypothetical protein
MTADEILNAFESSQEPPLDAVRTAAAAKELMLPAVLAEFERALTTAPDDLPYPSAYGIMLELLGEWADPRAYLPLAKFMALDEDAINLLLDASITESAERVMAAVATDDLKPIFAVIRNRKADEFARGVMYGALIRLAVKRPGLRAAVTNFLSEYRPTVEAEDSAFLPAAWAEAVAAFGLKPLEAAARAVVKVTEREAEFTLAEFEELFRQGTRDPSGAWFVREQLQQDPPDAAAVVATWRYVAEDEDEEDGEEAPGAVGQPKAVNPHRDVGRNDPCPCGSGKKYKKCCLEKEG